MEEGFRQHIQRYFPTFLNNVSADQKIQELGFRETPNYVLQLLETTDLSDWWEREYRVYLENINAILIVDLRDLDKYNNG